jgi:hypothetical protein
MSSDDVGGKENKRRDESVYERYMQLPAEIDCDSFRSSSSRFPWQVVVPCKARTDAREFTWKRRSAVIAPL